MSVNCVKMYQKNGATFANGDDAYADKNSLFGPELTDTVTSCYDALLTSGILLSPITKSWDQETFTLTVTKLVTSLEAYDAGVTWNNDDLVIACEAAGWSYIGGTQTTI